MQALRQSLLKVQMFLAPRRVVITRLLLMLEILLVLIGFGVSYNAAVVFDGYMLLVLEAGKKLGVVSLILYVLTLTPGIITRLQVVPQITLLIGGIILPFRRHLGILMFITAWLHMSFTTSLPQLVSNGFDPSKIELLLFQWMGQISWWLLFPLWLTSNDLSQKFMGRWWKRVHTLTYIAMFFIFLHVALLRSTYLYIMGIYTVLQVLSWLVYWRRTHNTVIAQPVGVAQQASVQPQDN